MKPLFLVFFFFAIFLFNGCLSLDDIYGSDMNDDDNQFSNNSSHNEKVIQNTISKFLGIKYNQSVVIDGVNVRVDCIGLIIGAYSLLGIDITQDFHKYGGNGVSRLYHSLMDRNLLHRQHPKVGDVIFWDNTWDRNGDGILNNDPLTHAGLVLSVSDDGLIEFAHAHYTRGVVIEYMNLSKPDVYRDADGKVINSIMFLNATPKSRPENWLTGQLLNKYGRIEF